MMKVNLHEFFMRIIQITVIFYNHGNSLETFQFLIAAES